MRNDITIIVNMLSENYSRTAEKFTGMFNILTSFELIKCYDLILKYCKDNQTRPSNNDYKQENGLLYINNTPIDRVALRYKYPNYEVLNNKGIDYESKILAMQEYM